MHLVAQRVVSPQGTEGINAFCYLHGPYVWLNEPPPEIAHQPGSLVNSNIEIQPPGNRVRSYLDIWSPDSSPSRAIAYVILEPIDLFESKPLPLRVTNGNVFFEFNVDFALVEAWRVELEFLLWRALAVSPC